MFLGRGFALILIWTLVAPWAGAAEPCLRKVLKEFDYIRRRNVDYLRVYGLGVRKGMVKVKDVLGQTDGVFVGTNGLHAYLYVDGVRYDGSIYFKSFGKVKRKVTAIPLGTVIRFKDLPPEQVAKLRTQLLRHEGTEFRTASCVHGVCQELSQAGIEVSGGQWTLPADLYERMIADGFTDTQGKPLNIEILQTSPDDLHHIVEGFERAQDHEVIRMVVVYAVMPALIAGAAGGIGYYIYTQTHRTPAPRSTPNP